MENIMSKLLRENATSTYEIATGSEGSGCLSKELLNKMIVGFRRNGQTLTDVYISQKEVDDINEWVDPGIDPVVREEISSNQNLWSIQIHKIDITDTNFSGKTQIIGFDFTNSTISEEQKLFRVKEYFAGINSNSEIFGTGIIDRSDK